MSAEQEARKWLASAARASGDSLNTALASAARASGDSLNTAEAGTIDALLGIGHALLDVAAAIREQTYAEGER